MESSPLCSVESPEEAERLIQEGADVNQEDVCGVPPLFRSKSRAIAQVLIDHGAIVVFSGDKALKLLVYAKDLSILELFLQNGALTNGTDCCGNTILHYCWDNIPRCNMLIQYGADPHARNQFLRRYNENEITLSKYKMEKD